MWKVYLIMFLITVIISVIWVYLIDKQITYKKENPDYNEKEGWLDWDYDNNEIKN
jgi:hypothetical protein